MLLMYVNTYISTSYQKKPPRGGWSSIVRHCMGFRFPLVIHECIFG